MRRGDKVALVCVTSLALSAWLSASSTSPDGFQSLRMWPFSAAGETPWRSSPNGRPSPRRSAGVWTRSDSRRSWRSAVRSSPWGTGLTPGKTPTQPRKPMGKEVFKGKAAGLVGDYLREFEGALEAQRMGPAEFSWVADRMARASKRHALTGSRRRIGSRSLRKYEERLRGCALGIHALRIATGFAN